MLPHLSRFSTSRRSLVSMALAVALLPGVAKADEESIDVVQTLSKVIVVQSNGQTYTQVPAAPISVQVRIQANAEVSGRVKSWEAYFELVKQDNVFIDLSEAGISKTYPSGQRPKKVDETETISVASSHFEHQVRAWCNSMADDLRDQGLTNQDIFGQDRKIKLMVRPWLDVSYTGIEGGLQQAYLPPQYNPTKPQIDLVCQKWQGSAVPHAGAMSAQQAEVVNLGLSIQEKATINGACRIRLDGWVTTDLKNAAVGIQFENDEGKVSELQTVNTGESKTATFSRWEDVPNHPEGQVRIVGDGFQSDWVSYDMNCVEGGPGGITAMLPPKLAMVVVPQGKVMVHGRVCPAVLKLVGVIEGQGAASGQALFFGSGYLSPLRDYSVSLGQKTIVGAEAPLDWDEIPAPPSPDAPLSQPRDFGFNVTNEDSKVIASLPKRVHFIECKPPKLNPALQLRPGGLAAEPSQPAAPAATLVRPRLKGNPSVAQPGLTRPQAPMLQPGLPRRDSLQRLRRQGN